MSANQVIMTISTENQVIQYINRKPSHTSQRREKITRKVEKIYKDSYEIYGSPKITQILNQNGEKVSQRYIYSIMRENSWKARYIKPYIQTTISVEFFFKAGKSA